MFALINQKNSISFLLNVLIAVALCLGINAIIFGSGWFVTDDAADKAVWFAPPGYVVGTVWVILFALIGAARYLLNEFGEAAAGAKNLLIGLLLFCLAYPIYTIGFTSRLLGLIGNMATIALTIFIITKVFKFSKTAAYLLIPIIIWVGFASLLTLAEMKLF